MRAFAALILMCILCFSAAAQDTTAQISEAQAEQLNEQRAREIGRALRCVVCQNQSIEESDASLAQDMRVLVRSRVKSGDSNDQVIAFMQDRYGDFVLLKPPMQTNTYVLWFAPFLLVLLGVVWFLRQSRKPPEKVYAKPLTQDELANLDDLDNYKSEP